LCWGSNSNGQLGNNTPPYSLVPVRVQFTPPAVADITEEPEAQPLPPQTSTDSAGHRTAYVLGGTAAAALAIVAVGTWAVWRRRRTS
jgi:hypothetical protein